MREWLQGDCLEIMPDIPDQSVDLILCDLPYGLTQNVWDSIIPLAPLWKEYWRIAKPAAPVVLTSMIPFSIILGASQIEYLKYEWIFEKTKPTGFLNAKKQPMKSHENILVFYRQQCLYKPQWTSGEPYLQKGGKAMSDNYGNHGRFRTGSPDGRRYPRSVQEFNNVDKPNHPTQKPVLLFEYMIRTYTNPGDHILDNCAGSGTTAIAADNTGRAWTCIEADENYSEAALQRIGDNWAGCKKLDLGLDG